MKRYILSIFAVVIAVGMVAFTAPEKEKINFSEYFFQLNTSPTLTNVLDEANWIISPVQNGSTGCTSGSAKACKIRVHEDYTYMDGGTRKLSQDADIQGLEVTTGNAIVTGGEGDLTPYNRD